MNIIVCIKQVPGTTEVKIDPQKNTLIREGIKNIINPLDTYALEEGLKLKERYGGKVTALSMGPPQAVEALREAISMGIDEGILLSDAALAGSDTWATAYALAAAIKKLGQADLIICGRQTTDGDTGQVGPELAEILKLPIVTYVSKVEEIASGRMRVQRLIEEGHETIESPVPAVITVVKEINVPRLPSLRGMMKAKGATIPIWTIKELGIDPGMVGLAGSATKVVKLSYPQRTSQGELLKGELASQVETLLARLRDAGLLK